MDISPHEPSPLRPDRIPLLAVRDVVFFPHMTLPLSVGREKSIKALEEAMRRDHLVLVVAQKQAQMEDPGRDDMYHFGVLAEVIQFLKMPDSTLKVFLQGLTRTRLAGLDLNPEKGFWEAVVDYPDERYKKTMEIEALNRHLLEIMEEYAKVSRRISPEALAALMQMPDPSRVADTVAANALLKITDRQMVLELVDIKPRLKKLIEMLTTEVEIYGLEDKIHTRVRSQIEKTQKQYYLTEQMKAIQKELRQKDDFGKELDEIKGKIKKAKMTSEAEEAGIKELARLTKMMPFSPESTVSRTYLDWLVNLPWSVITPDNLDLGRAEKILDQDHYDLEKAKERILDFLAVCKLTKKLKGPILCFVGPPGVGKTSFGSSIARAIGRKFVRISLGGVRDEAEIRGHRRTYIGSLPGRIIQSLRKAKSRNPVFLMDEIDKMGIDWRGDPSAALLEVLDPEQNRTFMDHYLDLEFDLSNILFITTANTEEGIPPSLRDRLEIIYFSGYTHRDKIAIAKGYLLPKQLKEHGLAPGKVHVGDRALDRIIHEYTREAGVRSLEREIANLLRKAAREIVQHKKRNVAVAHENLPKLLGIPKFYREKTPFNAVGVSTGLSWTEHGGETLAIEAISMPGKGNLALTGKLGSVMQESAQAAFSYVKSISGTLGVARSRFKSSDFHVHVPEGAIPKDGPSAGIAIATALASQVCGLKVKRDVAMTGEITLRGRVLPVGGLKEKVIAADREGIKTVIFPEGNKKDLEEIPSDVLGRLRLVPVKHFDDVLPLAIEGLRKKGTPKGAASKKTRDGREPFRPRVGQGQANYPFPPSAPAARRAGGTDPE